MRAREGVGICSELDRMLITLAERQDNVESNTVPESPLSKPETSAFQNSAVSDSPLFKQETSVSRMGDTLSPTMSTMEGNRLTIDDDVKPSFMKGKQLTTQDGIKPSLSSIRDGGIEKPRTEAKKKSSSRKTIKNALANTVTERPFTRSRMVQHVEINGNDGKRINGQKGQNVHKNKQVK